MDDFSSSGDNDCEGQVEQATRARIADEQGVLNDCDARAATLKSEAAVRALKVKRGARRGLRRTSPSVPQPTTSLDVTEQVSKLLGSAAKQNHAEQVAQETNRCTAVLAGSGGLYHGTNKIGETASRSHGTDGPVGGEEDDNAVSLAARAAQNAERAEDLARGLRRGLKLRDEVVASVNARDFCRGVNKARECLRELNAAQQYLVSAPMPASNDSDAAGLNPATGCRNGGCRERRASAGEQGHDHSHSHHHTDDGRQHERTSCSPQASGSGPYCCDTSRRPQGSCAVNDVTDSNRRTDEANSRDRAIGVLRRAKAMCRVAQGACFLQRGRVAQATETLRDLLLEDPASVPAWVARGEAFVAMGSPLLAGLHFDRALMLDPSCATAAVHKKALESSTKAKNTFMERDDAEITGAGEVPTTVVVSNVGAPTKGLRVSGEKGKSEGRATAESRRGDCAAHCLATEGVAGEEHRTAAFQEGTHDSVAKTTTTATRPKMAKRGGEESLFTEGLKPLLAEVCKCYREGVVLHQEQFLLSSSERFRKVLSCLDQVAAATSAAIGEPMSAAPTGVGEDGVPAVSEGGVGRNGEGRYAALTELRVGCHLNIAAAFLLRQTDYESAVEHCTRALVLTPGHTQALVRRAQAQESLGRFRRAVEDLEAAEATLEGGTRATHPWNCRGGFAERDGEVAEVKRRLEHARWTKMHVGCSKDELQRVAGGRGGADDGGSGTAHARCNGPTDLAPEVAGGRFSAF